MTYRPAASLATVVAVILLAACAPQIVTVTVTSPPKTIVVTATPSPTPDLAATAEASVVSSLTVCLVGEPDTLYLYGGSELPAAQHVMAALYDGPIDRVGYAYLPVILDKLPSLADGDAVTRTSQVRTGDRVVDAQGQVVELTEGVQVRPATCHRDDCAVEFTGEPVVMERLEVTFALRQDVTWSDGEPLTARDSVFAYRVASDKRTPGYRALAERTADYHALDDWRVKWVGLPGYVDPDYQSFFFPPLPRHQLEDLSAAQLVRAEETRRTPLGWGPFVVAEWTVGERITLARNPHYFRAGEGLPHLDELAFVFATDTADATARVLAGECDVALRDAYDPYLPLLEQLSQRGLLQVLSTPGERAVELELGIAPAKDYKRPDFFSDVRVRQAIVSCIDRQALVDAVAAERGTVLDSLAPPAHPVYTDTELTRWPYDPAAGLRLLEQAGWVDADGDGVSEAHGLAATPDGTPFEVTLLVPWSRTPLEEVGWIVRANLADCGIGVALEFQAEQVLLAQGPEGPLSSRRFDMALREVQLDATVCRRYLSSEIPDKDRWSGANVSGYSNADFDAACGGATTTLPGTSGYAVFQQKTLALYSTELPSVPLFVWPEISVTRPGSLTVTLDAAAPSALWSAETLSAE